MLRSRGVCVVTPYLCQLDSHHTDSRLLRACMDSIFQAVNLPPEACTPEAAKRHSPRADAPGDAKTAEMSVAPVRPHTASDPSRVKTSPTLNRFAHVNYWNRIILIGSSSLAVLAFDFKSTKENSPFESDCNCKSRSLRCAYTNQATNRKRGIQLRQVFSR